MTNHDSHPEQDPAEGSRQIIEKDLKRQRPADANSGSDANAGPEKTKPSSPGSEATEPSPE